MMLAINKPGIRSQEMIDLKKFVDDVFAKNGFNIYLNLKSLQIQRFEGITFSVGTAGQISNLLIQDLLEFQQLTHIVNV